MEFKELQIEYLKIKHLIGKSESFPEENMKCLCMVLDNFVGKARYYFNKEDLNFTESFQLYIAELNNIKCDDKELTSNEDETGIIKK